MSIMSCSSAKKVTAEDNIVPSQNKKESSTTIDKLKVISNEKQVSMPQLQPAGQLFDK